MKNTKHIHFIAIGGAAMHSLALALHQKGYKVTGSDDEIFEPSRSRLSMAGLLPVKSGWCPDKLSGDIDTVILGMHAKPDNPELIRAMELGLNVVSYPEFLYNETKDKQRIVIAGSHGKTTITAMVMHVLKNCGKKFDYMVGSALEGIDNMVSLQHNTELAVFEGDEYLSSPIDLRSKFFHYHPDILVINGISWDHMNVFPTFDNYKAQFRNLVEGLPSNAKLFYIDDKAEVTAIAAAARCETAPYIEHRSINTDGQLYLIDKEGKEHPVHVFGKHNLQNISAAFHVCKAVGIIERDFYMAIGSFKGTRKRLELIASGKNGRAYIDFAHAPSKVKATVGAVRGQFPNHRLVACFELHTYSSLNAAFLQQYQSSLDEANEAIVFYNPEVIKLKGLPPVTAIDIETAFAKVGLAVIDNPSTLEKELRACGNEAPTIYLLMSSGNFGGIDIQGISSYLVGGA